MSRLIYPCLNTPEDTSIFLQRTSAVTQTLYAQADRRDALYMWLRIGADAMRARDLIKRAGYRRAPEQGRQRSSF